MGIKGPYHHVHLVAHDPRVTADWYVQNLGGRITKEAKIRGSMTVRLQFGESRLNIRAPRPGETIVEPREGGLIGIDHFALTADEIDKMAAKFEESGVKIVEPIFATPDGGRALFIEGPDRVLIEILEAPSS